MAQQERAVRTRETVLVAAGEAFGENGFLGTSMADILARAGVTKGALYFHFSSKDELAVAVIEEQEEVAARIAACARESDQPPLIALVSMTTRWAHEIQSNPVVRAGVRLIIEQGTYERPMAKPYGSWAGLVIELLQRARDRGELRAGLDPETTAAFIVCAFTGTQLLSQVTSGHQDLQQRVEDMWKVLFSGLLPAGQSVLFMPSMSGAPGEPGGQP